MLLVIWKKKNKIKEDFYGKCKQIKIRRDTDKEERK